MNKKTKMFLLLLLLILSFQCFAENQKIIRLDALLNPEAFVMDDLNMYIVEGTQISIYSFNNMKLLKKFGKRGEGPGEFMPNSQSGKPMFLDVQGNNLIITSLGKISFFSKKGEFIREQRLHNSSGDELQPLGKNFIGQVILPFNRLLYRSIMRYGEKMQPLNEIIRIKHHFQLGRGFQVFRESMDFFTENNKLFITWNADFKISIFDLQGKLKQTIHQPYNRVTVTKKDKKDTIHLLKTHPKYKQFFEMLKPIQFPDKFPAIQNMRIADGKIYILTYKEQDSKTECFIYTQNGKKLKKIYIPLKKSNKIELYPFHFKNNRFYQFVEIDENWELHISKL